MRVASKGENRVQQVSLQRLASPMPKRRSTAWNQMPSLASQLMLNFSTRSTSASRGRAASAPGTPLSTAKPSVLPSRSIWLPRLAVHTSSSTAMACSSPTWWATSAIQAP